MQSKPTKVWPWIGTREDQHMRKIGTSNMMGKRRAERWEIEKKKVQWEKRQKEKYVNQRVAFQALHSKELVSKQGL